MFDVTSYANGFGVVFVPFVIGVLIRAILATLHAGSIRSNFISCVFVIFLIMPSFACADSFTGLVDSYEYNGSTFYMVNDSAEYYSENSDFNQILIESFNRVQEIVVVYDGLDNKIQNISVLSSINLNSRTISLLLGGMGCAAFALGISLKI